MEKVKLPITESKNHDFWTFVNYEQDNWSEKLAMAKIITINNISVSTKPLSFFALKRLYLSIKFNIVKLFNTSIYKQIFK